jgi:SAM-dependent methyltransferase
MVKSLESLPGEKLDASKMSGHWLLARLGKRVLRPGGIELTNRMLESLQIRPTDSVVEFAPGLGFTARKVLDLHPDSYTGIEGDEVAAANVRNFLTGPDQKCLVGRAENTSLPDSSATVVFGEAMLTMNSTAQKTSIIEEAYRVLQPGGRYGLHELYLTPDNLDESTKTQILKELSLATHVGARPLTLGEWRSILEGVGFRVKTETVAPMQLLEPKRLFKDEGFKRALRFIWNVLKDPAARKRVLKIRQVFRQYRQNIGAVMLVVEKPA